MTAELSEYAALLKEWYSTEEIGVLTYKSCPFFAMVPKATDLSGDSWELPLIYGDGGGSSATFSTASSNKSNVSNTKFSVTMADEYSLASISRKLMKASRDKKGAFMEAAKVEIDAAFRRSRNALGLYLFGDGTGRRGTIASESTTTLTLTDATEAVNFQVGMNIQVYDDSAAGFMTAVSVTGVNHAAGTITISAELSATVEDGVDTIYRAGDKDSVLTGLGGYLTTSSSPGALFGVTRTTDVAKLSGVKYSATTETVYEGLVNAQAECYTIGDGMPDHVFLHPNKFRDLLKEMSNRVQLTQFRMNERIGFQGFTVQGHHGEMRVFADRFCPVDKAYLLELDTWALGSLGPTLDIFDKDTDQEMLREGSSDAYEVRVGTYANLGCYAPGHNAVCYWSA